ncbi:cytochrome P460 family protein [Methylomonas sp. LL1]|uniref:cytochrome P460 family protein n=1 Tax=Methylomonas sp. LL1 TaxID=2785785 RepID=UPI0018C42543|nr:cytochrome P460 family protein [Methylomonas sp. LL1]QPK64617.1 cytochrome P460 family protein [Methylomonas sp. LL1]
MKNNTIVSWLLASAMLMTATQLHAEAQAEKPVHGEYKDWLTLSVSHRLDKKLVRSIVGNDIAIKAARAGNTKPWPDGTIIAKVGWKEKTHPNWPQAVVPGEFAGAEAMVKDSKKFAETGGWGFGHWEGDKLVMNDKEKSATCFACHSPMKDADYVYTVPAMQ